MTASSTRKISIVRTGRGARPGAALLVALCLLVGGAPAPVLALSPSDGGAVTLFPVTINASAGDQFDPHVSGDLAAYTSDESIRYYDFFSGNDLQVPRPLDATDQLSDVSNGKIVFSRLDAALRLNVFVYDTTVPSMTEIDPSAAAPLRSNAAIGSNTVAYIDQGLAFTGELVAADLGAATTRITTDTRVDRQPQVAPLGDLIVYESCQTSAANCDVRQAGWNGSSWVVTNLTNNADPEANPDSDGVIVVYDATRSGERAIRWQPVGGGTEEVIDLAGEQRNPSVSAGVIAFESVADPVTDTAADLYVYEVSTNRLFRITNTVADESLNDVFVFPDGRVRVVWASGADGSRDVYGATFEIPPAGPTYGFGGFLQPVEPRPTLNALKSGAAVPVKFSLGGDRGLDIFAAGYPISQVIACDATADVDAIEQTVTAGGSSLTYDPTTDVYTYVWKTDKAWAGTCRQLVLGLADGTVQRANFIFK